MKPTGITRVRNEALIIADTIEHYLGHCDNIILYDDCSTDDTIGIAMRTGGSRVRIIPGDEWRTDRKMENTRHRAILTRAALESGAEWCLCFDADERLVGTLPPLNHDATGYRFRLFDGYLTREVQGAYTGGALADLPRMWGPEYRDIIMLFRIANASFVGTGRREPAMTGRVRLAPVMVKHYGKCLSVEHWEETCRYYSTYFPEPFKSKWVSRRGKAIHTRSDFDRPLFGWAALMDSPIWWTKL